MIEPIEIPDATTQPAEYVQALLATLGNRDPLTVYRETPALVAKLCEGLSEPAWRTPMADGEWSALQVVGHLFDVDVVYGFRWRLALSADDPTYPGYDEKRWAELARPAIPDLLAAVTALRTANVALLDSLDEGSWRRTAVHGEQGREDIQRMLDKIAGHDLAHRNQLTRTVTAVTARAT